MYRSPTYICSYMFLLITAVFMICAFMKTGSPVVYLSPVAQRPPLQEVLVLRHRTVRSGIGSGIGLAVAGADGCRVLFFSAQPTEWIVTPLFFVECNIHIVWTCLDLGSVLSILCSSNQLYQNRKPTVRFRGAPQRCFMQIS